MTTTAPRHLGTPPPPPRQVDVEMPEEHSGSVIDMLGQRKGSMLEMGSTSPEGILSVVYEARSRRDNASDAPEPGSTPAAHRRCRRARWPE